MGKTRVGKLMQLLGASIDAMARAQDTGQDPFAALDADVGWDTLLGKRDEIVGFGALATSDPLSLATERYAYMRRFAPAFLEAFQFNATDAGDDLKDAIALLRDQNRTGKRKLPDDPPMPFAANHNGACTKRPLCPPCGIACAREMFGSMAVANIAGSTAI